MFDFRKLWTSLSQVYTGWTREPQRGGCAGDPQSWEREIQRRANGESLLTPGEDAPPTTDRAPEEWRARASRLPHRR